SIGVLLGSVLPSARAAQAVGLLLFFPSFLLGAGGPPPRVMGSIVKQVAGPLPLTLLTNAVRAPWLGLGPATGSLIGVAVLAAGAVVAVGAAALLVLGWRPVLLYAAVATAGIAVLGNGTSSNIGWFAVCLLAGWCVLAGTRREGLAYWAGAMLLFASEWLWGQ